MIEDRFPESSHERRVTWSLMAVVVGFVLLMSCIVLWITSSLIQNERGGAVQSNSTNTIGTPPTDTPVPPTITRTSTPTAILETPQVTMLVDTPWTPVPGRTKYVRFLYWYVRPNKIHVGECLQLTWETEYAVSLELYRNGELVLENAPSSKTFQDCPKQPGYAVYRMVGTNSAGQSNWIQLQVKVVEPP